MLKQYIDVSITHYQSESCNPTAHLFMRANEMTVCNHPISIEKAMHIMKLLSKKGIAPKMNVNMYNGSIFTKNSKLVVWG